MKLFNYQDSIDSKKSRNTTRFNTNSKEREQERFKTQQIFILIHPTNGLCPVPHIVRISLKMIN